MTYALVALGLLLLNAATIFAFWYDKRLAINRQRRIRESDLLLLAMFGGTPGAFYARAAFRHKTRKEPFGTMLMVILMVQVGGLLGLALF